MVTYGILWYYYSDIFSVFSVYSFTICHPTCCCVNCSTFSHENLVSAVLANTGTMAWLLSQNGLRSLRSNLRASNLYKSPGGACPQTPLILHAYTCIRTHQTYTQAFHHAKKNGEERGYKATSDTHVTPLAIILATDLILELI